ncbi:chromate reductase [Saccharothrix ecbatanensis]|uniref:Chromate reductase n=1 Tax=Saccharothrix ecbatanensis TaxID=1105145 RepID=A0A7W9M663_9PSEU|nr:NAD(P)H-dependent oxidoreductase [Saccharothrix ecbatanensis]MBB5808574.1 chromate reductase [Saccharothrix ecbatanensis]
MEILGIAGSIRAQSFNRRLLAAARHELPDGVRLAQWDGLASVPPFDEDAEDGPVPPAVAELREAIASAASLLIATPEYNGSIPGQLKNALDWASRPRGAAVLAGKPVAVVGASPSPHGAAMAQGDLRRVLTTSGASVVGEPVVVGQAFRQFDEHDRLLDHELRAALAGVLVELTSRVVV